MLLKYEKRIKLPAYGSELDTFRVGVGKSGKVVCEEVGGLQYLVAQWTEWVSDTYTIRDKANVLKPPSFGNGSPPMVPDLGVKGSLWGPSEDA